MRRVVFGEEMVSDNSVRILQERLMGPLMIVYRKLSELLTRKELEKYNHRVS